MKLGLIGPAEDMSKLGDAIEFLLGEAEVDAIVYLGLDPAIEHVAQAWAAETSGSKFTERDFLEEVAAQAPQGNASAIDTLLAIDRTMEQLARIQRVPEAPARAIELLGDRFITLVWDKAVLAEEDIANSFVVAFGKSDRLLLKRFGPRIFFSPGPLDADRLAVLEADDDGIVLSIFSASGVPISREMLGGLASTRITVSA